MSFLRTIRSAFLELLTQYAVITVTGPRQSGKTTLVQKLLPSKPYINLENPEILSLAIHDPQRFLGQFPAGAILDEVQRAPHLFSYIQVIVDEKKQKGMFILTGSQQFNLHEKITQSLAGRTAILKLLPFSLQELAEETISLSTNQLLLRGFYPKLYDQPDLSANVYYRNYLETYIERDVRQLSNVKDLHLFHRFVKLCAGRIGQVFKAEHLANELGVARPTIQHWISILEASYLIVLLDPYFENFGKRIIKSPKLYFVDVGLASYLLDIETEAQLDRDPLRGALFENMVILEMIKQRYNRNHNPNLYYFRDQNRYEVDIIYKTGHDLIPVEIKSSETFAGHFIKNIEYFKRLAPERVPLSFVVYAGNSGTLRHQIDTTKLINYSQISQVFAEAPTDNI